MTLRFLLLFMLASSLASCYDHEDVVLEGGTWLFYAENKPVVFLNEATGQSIELHPSARGCYESGTEEREASSFVIKVYHLMNCGQVARKSEEEITPVDHSILSYRNIDSNIWKIYFNHSVFAFDGYKAFNGALLDSTEIRGTWYYDVLVLANQLPASSVTDFDSLYVNQSAGILKVVAANHENWVVQ